jgi:hypothetical protein
VTIQLHRNFRTKVAKLKAANADDQTVHDTLAAFMDQHGVPVFLLEDFRDEPVIVALFAERGQRLMTPEQKAGLDAGHGDAVGDHQQAAGSPMSRLPSAAHGAVPLQVR